MAASDPSAYAPLSGDTFTRESASPAISAERVRPDAQSLADEELMLQYQAGDAGAFTQLYERHKGGVYRYFVRQCRAAQTAEELLQDVWLNIIRARHTYLPTAKFSTYLYRLAHNRLIDHYRSLGHVIWLSPEEDAMEALAQLPGDPLQQPEVQTAASETAARIFAAINKLPPAQREAFLLQQESGLSVEDIAGVTDVSFETAKSRLRYALAKLRAELRDLL